MAAHEKTRAPGWRWKPAGSAAEAEPGAGAGPGLLYEPGNWGDVLKGSWTLAVTRALLHPKEANRPKRLRYLDPFAGAPSYPLPESSAQRLDRIPASAFAHAQRPYRKRRRLASTARLVRDACEASGAAIEMRLFDLDPERRAAWRAEGNVAVSGAGTGEALFEAALRETSPPGLILLDPYDFFDHWGAWLPRIIRAARRSAVLVYLYNKSPRGSGHAAQYRRFRRALAEGGREPAGWLLGRLASDPHAPRAYHEMLLLGAIARQAALREELRALSGELARCLGHGEAFEMAPAGEKG